MIAYNTLIVLLGTGLLGALAGLVGTFAVLRGRALLGDALAHAALPGLCVAFWIVGAKSLPAMLLGALASGIIGVALVAFLRAATPIREDAALGIVLSTFFGLGVVLSRIIQNRFAEGSKAGLDSYILGKTAGVIAEDVLIIGAVSLVCLAALWVLYKEFKLILFDSEYARSQGWPAAALDFALMFFVSLTVVVGLPAVGVVLVAALLFLPSGAARFWTDRLGSMLFLATFFGFGIGAAGTLASAAGESLPAGPVIILVGAAVFLVSLLVAPRRGLVSRWLATRRLADQLAEQRILRRIFDLVEAAGPTKTSFDARLVGKRLGLMENEVDRRLAILRGRGLVQLIAIGRYQLTPEGLGAARQAALEARLWELLLDEHPGWQNAAVRLGVDPPRAVLPEALIDDLEQRLRELGRWPAPEKA